MITDPDQIEALIQSTADLIEESGLDIALSRSVLERTPAGGVRHVNPEPLPAARRYFGTVSSDPPRVIREEGEQLVLRHVLVGMPGDDIKEKDTFQIGTRKFEVVEVDVNEGWQTKGWVTERA